MKKRVQHNLLSYQLDPQKAARNAFGHFLCENSDIFDQTNAWSYLGVSLGNFLRWWKGTGCHIQNEVKCRECTFHVQSVSKYIKLLHDLYNSNCIVVLLGFFYHKLLWTLWHPQISACGQFITTCRSDINNNMKDDSLLGSFFQTSTLLPTAEQISNPYGLFGRMLKYIFFKSDHNRNLHGLRMYE